MRTRGGFLLAAALSGALAGVPGACLSLDEVVPTNTDAGADAPTESEAGSCSITQHDCNGDANDGCETNIDNDKQHCGSCDRDCLGLSCLDGACQPQVLAPGIRYTSLAVDSTHVYFTAGSPAANGSGPPPTDGFVFRVTLDGKDATTVVAQQKHPTSLALVGSDVLFVNGLPSDGEIALVPKEATSADGSAATASVLSTLDRAAVIVADAAASYVSTCTSSDAIYKLAHGTNTLQTFESGEGACALFVFGNELFWIVGDGTDGEIRSKPTSQSTGAKTVTSGLIAPADLAVTASETIWVEAGVGAQSGEVKLLANGSPVATTIAIEQAEPRGVATDGAFVYWTNHAGGEVMRAELDGSAPTKLATGQNHPRAIVLDANFVYWVNVGVAPDFADTAIVKARK